MLCIVLPLPYICGYKVFERMYLNEDMFKNCSSTCKIFSRANQRVRGLWKPDWKRGSRLFSITGGLEMTTGGAGPGPLFLDRLPNQTWKALVPTSSSYLWTELIFTSLCGAGWTWACGVRTCPACTRTPGTRRPDLLSGSSDTLVSCWKKNQLVVHL